jgi:uncharacterized protein YraI
MKFSLGASLAAMLYLYAGSAFAGSAVLNSDMTAFEGPGDNYRPVLNLVAGQRIDVIECNFKQWCQIEHDGTLGWVHASLAAPKKSGGDGSAGVPGSDSGDTASGGGTTGGSSGGGKTPKFSKVGGEITQTGDGSSGGSSGGTTARQRFSATGGSSGGSSPPASVATESAPPPSGDTGKLATMPSCFRC